MGHQNKKWELAWQHRDRRPTVEWSRDSVFLVPPLTQTGYFDSSGSRHLEGPLEALDDLHVRDVNCLKPVRGGGTLIADVFSMSVISRTPGPLLWVFQEDKSASDQAELRTWPIIRASQKIRALLPETRAANRTTEIIFPSMPLHIRGPALSNLQSRGYQVVFGSECWMYKEGRIDEMKGRLGDYVRLGTDKLYLESQGSTDGDDWDRQCKSGVGHLWGVQCEKCDRFFDPVWTFNRPDGTRGGMAWNKVKTSSGAWDIPKCLPSVRYECPACGHPHIDSPRVKSNWNRTGRYIAEETDKSPTKKTFNWRATISYPWVLLTEEYLSAVNAWKMGNTTMLIQFFQKKMAENKSEGSILEAKLNIRRAQYEITTKPNEGWIRMFAFDRQDQDVYWGVGGDFEIGTGRFRRIYFGKVHSDSEIEDVRIKFECAPNHLLIDSGFRPKGDHGVYRSCIKYGWIPVKGVGQGPDESLPTTFTHTASKGERFVRSYSEPIIADSEIGTADQGERFTQFIKFSSPTFADRLEKLIDSGLWIDPEGMDSDPMEQEYRVQMADEIKKTVKRGNKISFKLVNIWVSRTKNNHARDCCKILVLGATLMEIFPDMEGQ